MARYDADNSISRRGKDMKNRCLSKWRGVVLIAACLLLFSAGSASGAGFALIEQGVSGLGNAYAGGAASAEDATTIFFNPAGMALLKSDQLIFGSHLIVPFADFENQGSTHALQGLTGVPLRGDDDGDAGVAKVVPNFYYSRKVSDRFAVGIGINVPFGLATEYDKTWVGRYHAIESEVMTVNINPSVAYRINEHWSIGAGISLQYIKATLSNAIDFGTLDAAGAFFPTLGLAPGSLGLIPQLSDGYASLEGDSWGWGYNLGIIHEFTPHTRIGVAYRSSIRHTLDGDVDFSGVPSGLHPYPLFRDGGVEADLDLPDSVSVSFFHQINPQWMVMADWTWTNWRLFEDLIVQYDNSHQPSTITSENWQDSYRYSLGLTYLHDKNWTFRTGTAYDTSAVASSAYRTPRIPDSDRIWTALGFGYRVSDKLSFDCGYAHLFINDPQIYKSATGEDALRGGLRGAFETHVNIISAQLNLTF